MCLKILFKNKNMEGIVLRDTDEITRFTRLYKYHIDKIISQHPVSKKSLTQLLSESHPYVELQDGSRHSFSREELKKFSEMIPRELWDLLKLPFLIGKISGTSIYKIVDCNNSHIEMLNIFIKKNFLDKDETEMRQCMLTYRGLRKLLSEFSSLIILTIIQESDIERYYYTEEQYI
ncbi:MAG: DUF61 family protein [Desulfurococcaceae archaeon]|nr:DUF61 family protein [Desulfurococcaceae archaeon]